MIIELCDRSMTDLGLSELSKVLKFDRLMKEPFPSLPSILGYQCAKQLTVERLTCVRLVPFPVQGLGYRFHGQPLLREG